MLETFRNISEVQYWIFEIKFHNYGKPYFSSESQNSKKMKKVSVVMLDMGMAEIHTLRLVHLSWDQSSKLIFSRSCELHANVQYIQIDKWPPNPVLIIKFQKISNGRLSLYRYNQNIIHIIQSELVLRTQKKGKFVSQSSPWDN